MLTPFVIAEAGSTHDGALSRMLRLILLAHTAGANAVKFQWHSDATRLAERMHAPEAEATYRRYGWPADWLPILSEHAHRLGLEFLCTVDLPEDIAVVAPYVDRFKIASWGATDHDFIKAHAKYGKPIVISTGAMDENEWHQFCLAKVDRGAPEAWYLHCVSAYPTPLAEANLGVIRAYDLDGFSDHTANVMTGAFAVCAGARVLEVHVRHEHTDPENPDYVVSLSPSALVAYVNLAREAAKAMGDGVKKVQPSEAPNRRHRYIA